MHPVLSVMLMVVKAIREMSAVPLVVMSTICCALQRQELLKGDSVRVRMSPNPVPTINKANQTTDWFGSLERCFGWNERMEQKPLQENKSPAKTLSPEAQNGSF